MNKNESKYFNTARLMDEALLLLLDKKEYEFITVKEICQKAGVNRSTFYLHYEGVEDLFRETVEMISERFFEAFNGEKTRRARLVRSGLLFDYAQISHSVLKLYFAKQASVSVVAHQTKTVWLGNNIQPYVCRVVCAYFA